MKRREFLIQSAGLTGALLPFAVGATTKPCPPTTLNLSGGGSVTATCSGKSLVAQIAERLSATSTSGPAWSGPEVGLSSINADVHYWGEPPPSGPIVGGRQPFTAPNGISDRYNIADWPGKAHWDPTGENWWYSGGPTGNQDPASPTIVRYAPDDDRFVHWQGPASMKGGIWPPYGHAHSFDAADLDVKGRRIWRHLGRSNSLSDYNYALGWFNIDTFESGTVSGDGIGVDYWPTISFLSESRVLHIVRQKSAGSPNISRFNVDSRMWLTPVSGQTGDSGPSVAYAGRVFVATTEKNFYAILPDGRIEVRAPTPVVMERSSTWTQAILCPIGAYIYAFCGNGEIWRYDLVGDSWGGQPYHSIPWNWPYATPNPSVSSWHYMTATCVGPVAAHGVALICSPAVWAEKGTAPARAWVWKP